MPWRDCCSQIHRSGRCGARRQLQRRPTQVAVTIDEVPNAIFESVGSLRSYLNQEGAFQVQKALDGHVMAQIVGAAPPFGTSGTGLVARIRNGIATMRATGANPTTAVLNPTDAASLDLEADAGGYIFPTRDTGTSSPLWGLKVVERIGAGTEAPYSSTRRCWGSLTSGTCASRQIPSPTARRP